MKLFSSVAVDLLAGAAYLVSGSALTCVHDNCFRALFPTTDAARLASAQSFCKTYTQGISTASTGFNPRFTTACSLDPSKYSSACSCAPTATASSTPTKPPTPCTTINDLVFKNGDFECGLFPWRALHADGTTADLTSSGFDNSLYAFKVSQNVAPDSVGLGEATLSQLFQLTSGTHYTLQFRTFWSAGNGGFIGVKINGQPVFTVDAEDNKGPGVWNLNTLSFTAATGQHLLEFEFLIVVFPVAVLVDDVKLTPGK